MKMMKRFAAGLLAIGMVLSLTACGGSDDEEHTVVMSYADPDVPEMATSVTFTAIGDKVQTEKDVIEVDISDLDEEQKDALASGMRSLYEDTYKGLAEITEDITDTTYTLTATIDYKNDYDALKEAGVIDSGILSNDSISYVSLAKTQQDLETQGFRVVE